MTASAQPVVAKLGLKAGQRFLVLNAPRGYVSSLGSLPAGVTVTSTGQGTVDVIQVFVSSHDELARQVGLLRKAVNPTTRVWITYPKGNSGVSTDLNRDRIRTFVEARGWKAVALFAVDETWSALRIRAIN